jgi:hypothetical protein
MADTDPVCGRGAGQDVHTEALMKKVLCSGASQRHDRRSLRVRAERATTGHWCSELPSLPGWREA